MSLLLTLLLACSQPEAPALPPVPRVVVRWDAATGRGDVVHHLGRGDRMRTCFHCAYDGYTGGLVIGNESGSGMGLYPKEPIRGFDSINLFCAQDESIHDLSSGLEYTYGWSENMGEGAGGERLEYVRGEVVEAGPDRVALRSRNAGGCYRVDKAATTRADAPWWIVATRVTNRCDHPIHFDLYSGDDPWLGLYASSEGDVGWTPAGLVRHETALSQGLFEVGGFYDLGNSLLSEEEGSFSNQASFFALDPASPLPDQALFANRFAHAPEELDPERALDNDTLTALNLVWSDRTLQPGENLTWAMAMGQALTGEPGSVPQVPEITDEDWSAWRALLGDGTEPLLEFAAERVVMSVQEGRLDVDAVYTFRNATAGSLSSRIEYPVLVSEEQTVPQTVRVGGQDLTPDGEGVVSFPVQLPAHGILRVPISYSQVLTGPRAAYLVTTAREWSRPIDRAVFVVRYDSALGEPTVSLPVDGRREGELTVVEEGFWPESEVVVSW